MLRRERVVLCAQVTAHTSALCQDSDTVSWYMVLYSAFMSLWATVFLEFWKRRSATLAFRWDVLSSGGEVDDALEGAGSVHLPLSLILEGGLYFRVTAALHMTNTLVGQSLDPSSVENWTQAPSPAKQKYSTPPLCAGRRYACTLAPQGYSNKRLVISLWNTSSFARVPQETGESVTYSRG